MSRTALTQIERPIVARKLCGQTTAVLTWPRFFRRFRLATRCLRLSPHWRSSIHFNLLCPSRSNLAGRCTVLLIALRGCPLWLTRCNRPLGPGNSLGCPAQTGDRPAASARLFQKYLHLHHRSLVSTEAMSSSTPFSIRVPLCTVTCTTFNS